MHQSPLTLVTPKLQAVPAGDGCALLQRSASQPQLTTRLLHHRSLYRGCARAAQSRSLHTITPRSLAFAATRIDRSNSQSQSITAALLARYQFNHQTGTRQPSASDMSSPAEPLAPIVNEKGELEWKELPWQSLLASATELPIIGIGVEEHIALPTVSKLLPATVTEHFHFDRMGKAGELLPEMGQVRLKAMNDTATAIQVISVAGTGAESFSGPEAVSFARAYNDAMKAAIDASPAPERFRAFAHLPMQDIVEAIAELERCVALGFPGVLVSGMIGDKFLDDPMFDPLLSALERLDTPIYLHPAPPKKEISDVYYHTNANMNEQKAFMLSIAGYGWHSEVAVHVLRLCYSGTLDRHRKLKVMIGHLSEGLAMLFQRSDGVASRLNDLERPVSRMLQEQVWVSVSGWLELAPLQACLSTFGADRMTFSCDWPFVQYAPAETRNFLKALRQVVSEREYRAIMYGNVMKLMKIK